MANAEVKGLMPTGKIYPPHKHRITASADEIYIGSPVQKVAAGTVSIGGNTGAICGAVASIFDSDGVPASYYPGGSLTGYTCMVYDDPDQEFIMSEDGDTTDIALTDEGGTADLINAGSGSSTTGLSSCQIDSSTAATASNVADTVRIIAKVDAPDNALGDNCRWRVKINAHQFVDNLVGV